MQSLLAVPIPYVEPDQLFAPLAARRYALWLDSALPDADAGRYAYLMSDPFCVVHSRGDQVWVDGAPVEGNPWEVLAERWRRYRLPSQPNLPPFQTGVAGYWGYELARHLERLPVPQADVDVPEMMVGFYDVIVALDLHQRRAWILASGFPEHTPAARWRRARARAEQMRVWLSEPPPQLPDPPLLTVASNFTPQGYCQSVRRVREYILAGDIFQANFTQRFRGGVPVGYPYFALYHRLRRRSPAPYAAYLNFGEVVIASASPERFLRLDAGRVDTRPIKGTRPRGVAAAEDAALADELLRSEKDRAENTMIVDLLRNDLSRVCLPGSVRVPRLCSLESYATVHHLVSTVTGELEPGRDALDLLKLAFPGGSITGAPKIRAMEIIAELEGVPRGPYCGSIGYLSFSGDMDTSIVIRTLIFVAGQVFFSVGGGVVADSDPEAEYQESMDKARALLDVLEGR